MSITLTYEDGTTEDVSNVTMGGAHTITTGKIEAPNPERLIHIEYTYQIQDGKDDNSLAWTKLIRRPNGVLWVSALWVHPEHRGKGWARSLLSTVVREWGHEALYLEVAPYTDRPMDSERLTCFYASFGFVETPVPAIMMRKADGSRKRFIGET
jgi:GNAT superfamily N-acetyltransferase